MSELPEVLYLRWEVLRSLSWERVSFDFSLVVTEEIRSILDSNWWIVDIENLAEFWLEDYLRGKWFNWVKSVVNFAWEIHTIH